MNALDIGLVNLAYLLISPLVFTLGIGMLLWYWRDQVTKHSWQAMFALWCALFVAGNFLGALSSQGQLEKLHKVQFGEIYHYYTGSKYYKELKNTELYRCTWLGFQDMAAEGRLVPNPRMIRDLEITWGHENLDELRHDINTRCNGRFTEKRWAQFTADLGVFLEVRGDTKKWHRIFVDYGNNPPPTWNLIAGVASNLIPLTPTSLKFFIWVDLGLILLLVPLVIWRSFGLVPAIGYVLLTSVQPMLLPGMDGAAFFRHMWLAAMALGLCALHSRKFVTAGVLLGLSTSLRIFPAIFAFGAALPLLWAWRDLDSRRALIQLISGLCATGATLLALSIIVYGLDHWQNFLMILDSHANNLASNSIGYKRHLLSFLYTRENALVYAQGPGAGQGWFQYLDDNLEYIRVYMVSYIAAILLMAGAVSIRLRPAEAAMVFGTVCMFFLTSAYGYYYIFLPLLAVVWLAEKVAWRTTIQLLCLLSVFLIVAWYFPFHYITLIGYYTAATNVLFTALVGLVTTAYGFLYRTEIKHMVIDRKFCVAQTMLLAVAVYLVAGAFYTLAKI